MENIDKAIEILTAFKEGKTIEWYDGFSRKWLIVNDITKMSLFEDNIRVKPQPTYRPYANVVEFINASKEHGPFIVRKTTIIPDISNSYAIFDSYIAIAFSNEKGNVGFQKYTYKDLFDMSNNNYISWYDGTPCCILEQ